MKVTYAEAEYGKVVLREKDLSGPGPGQVLLEAEYSSISPGTEHGIMAGKLHPLPQGIGYSMVARVLDVGAGVTDYKAGDSVVATGQHASHLILDERILTPAPDGVDLEQAAFFILAHTALYGVRRTKIQLGEAIVVLGQGLVGIFAAQLARLSGACPVIVTDIDDGRLAVAKSMGAHHAINTRSQPEELDRVVDGLGLGGVPVVFEATGTTDPVETAFRIVGERGRLMILSTVHPDTGKTLRFDEMLSNLFMKGATFVGGYVNSKPFSLKRNDLTIEKQWPPILLDNAARFVSAEIWTSDEDIRAVLNLIKYGALDIRPLITHRFRPEQIPEAYDLVWRKDPSLLGGLITWK